MSDGAFLKPALDVTLNSYDDQTLGLEDIIGNQVPDVLSTLYAGAPIGTQVTLLHARAETFRSISLADDTAGITVDGTSLGVDIGPQELLTFASLNWTPYVNTGPAWDPDDIGEYLGFLDGQMRISIDVNDLVEGEVPPEGFDEDLALEGAVGMAKAFYASIYEGLTGLVEVDGELTSQDVISDVDHDPGNQTAIAFVLSEMLDFLQAVIEESGSITVDGDVVVNSNVSFVDTRVEVLHELGFTATAVKTGTEQVGLLLKQLVPRFLGLQTNFGNLAKYSKLGAVKGSLYSLAALSAAVGFGVFEGLIDDDTAYVWVYGTAVAGGSLMMVSNLAVMYKIAKAGVGLRITELSASLHNATRINRVAAAFGLSIDVGIAFGFLVYNVLSQDLLFNSGGGPGVLKIRAPRPSPSSGSGSYRWA